jgi:hypothetical protein
LDADYYAGDEAHQDDGRPGYWIGPIELALIRRICLAAVQHGLAAL